MNFSNAPKISRYVDVVNTAVSFGCADSMKRAVEESVDLNETNNLSVALDGTWHKRGHLSLNGVVTATSVDAGKIIDYEAMSKYCRCPDKLKNKHLQKCTANYSAGYGSAGCSQHFQTIPRFVQRTTCELFRRWWHESIQQPLLIKYLWR